MDREEDEHFTPSKPAPQQREVSKLTEKTSTYLKKAHLSAPIRDSCALQTEAQKGPAGKCVSGAREGDLKNNIAELPCGVFKVTS